MDDATTPGDRAPTAGAAGRLRDTGLAVLFAIGVVMALTRDDLHALGVLLMVASAVVFLAVTVVRWRRRGSSR
jgi:drug/metabolite transporter (DMT)-like permease